MLSLLRAEGLGDVREHVYLSDFIRTTRRRLLLRSEMRVREEGDEKVLQEEIKEVKDG